jgi:hypothetical protein
MARTKVLLSVTLAVAATAIALPQPAHSLRTSLDAGKIANTVAGLDDVTSHTVVARAQQTLTDLENLEESAKTLAASVGMSVTWLNGTALFSNSNSTDTDSAWPYIPQIPLNAAARDEVRNFIRGSSRNYDSPPRLSSVELIAFAHAEMTFEHSLEETRRRVEDVIAATPTRGPSLITATTGRPSWSTINHGRLRAVLFALSQLNKPYVAYRYGPSGYDCGGLVFRAWLQADVNLSTWEQRERTTAVRPTELLPGDLVFWDHGWNDVLQKRARHTAMYLGPNMMVESFGGNVDPGVRLSRIRSSGLEFFGHVTLPGEIDASWLSL